MRMRIIAAAVVLGLGIVGITLAQQQQAGQQPKDQAGDRAKLRAQVARIRAEVEVLELEHGVDAEILRECLKALKRSEFMASMKGPIKEYAKTVVEGSKTETSRKTIPPPSTVIGPGLEAPPEPVHVPVPYEMYDMAFDESGAMARLGRPAIERLKKEFVDKTAELAEKRLELAELEKRYNETR